MWFCCLTKYGLGSGSDKSEITRSYRIRIRSTAVKNVQKKKFKKSTLLTTTTTYLNLLAMQPWTASSMSADSKTMNAALPPNSSPIRFIVPAPWRYRIFPTLTGHAVVIVIIRSNYIYNRSNSEKYTGMDILYILKKFTAPWLRKL